VTAVGHSKLKARLEDKRMTTGAGRYASDWNLPGQAYAHILRADRAHAQITMLDSSKARAHPGVIAVLRRAMMSRRRACNRRPLTFRVLDAAESDRRFEQ
jgi:CO/xanthine dehydrogenase Mo-binding subunit